MTVHRDTLELYGVMLLAVVTCVLALLLIIGFLLLPVKTASQPALHDERAAITAVIDEAN